MFNKVFNILVSILRVYLGFWFFYHAIVKFLFYPDKWVQIGSAMQNLGINFFHSFWGLMAVLTYLVGGLFLGLGIYTRTSSIFLAFTMLVAFIMHINLDHGFMQISLLYLVIFILFAIFGSGTYTYKTIIALIKN